MTSLTDQINTIKNLSNKDDIIKAIGDIILSNLFKESIELEKLKNMYVILKRDIDPSDNINDYIEQITTMFPNCIDTPYHIHKINHDPDFCYETIKSSLKNSDGIIDAINSLGKYLPKTCTYPNDHIVTSLLSLDIDPKKIWNFKSDDKYTQLLIKSCKIRSIMKGWPGKYDGGDYKSLIIDVIDSEIPELIKNMALEDNDLNKIKAEKYDSIKSNISDFIKKALNNMTPDEKQQSLQDIIASI